MPPPATPGMNPRLAAVPAYPQVRLDAAKKRAAAAGRRLFDMGVGDPLEPTPSFIRQALLDNVATTSQYPSSFGSEELRTTIAAYWARVYGVTIDADKEIFVSAGS